MLKDLQCPGCSDAYTTDAGERDLRTIIIGDSAVAWCPCGTVFVHNPSGHNGTIVVYDFCDTDVSWIN